MWESNHLLQPNFLSLNVVKLRGINPLQLLRNNKIHAKELLLDSGTLRMHSRPAIDSIQVPLSKSKISGIDIRHITLRNIKTELKTDSLVKMEAVISLSFGAFVVTTPDKILESIKSGFRYLQGSVKHVVIKKDRGFYTLRANQIDVNSVAQSISVDSVLIVPNYGKYEFARALGQQTDRADVSINKITFHGMDFKKLLDTAVSVHKISVHQALLYVFRDKRMPDGNRSVKQLPMAALKKLPFPITIDSIVLDNSRITIEEFSQEGFRPGYVTFQNLSATLVGLGNRYNRIGTNSALLHANAKMMGSGLIRAVFHFPLDERQAYTAQGVLSNLPLKDLNPILENTAQIRIESGTLQELLFNFSYNDQRSDGHIEIKYDGLHMTRLNAGREKSTNFFQTFLLNAFVKNKKNTSTALAKRSGKIEVQRNPHRSIFQYWWSSVQSGLKDSVMGKPEKSPKNSRRSR